MKSKFPRSGLQLSVFFSCASSSAGRRHSSPSVRKKHKIFTDSIGSKCHRSGAVLALSPDFKEGQFDDTEKHHSTC
ncbi:MAG: hypothetical protein ACL93V_08660 [Candidatus Electrothrix sp. YB6]